MRKFLFAVLAILILVLVFFLVRDGLSIGKINILGVTEIQALNGQVDQKIAEATELTQQDFNAENQKLNDALEDVATQRERYETVLAQSSKEDIQEALTQEKYEVEKLWISIGNYADEHNVKVNMQITNSSSGIAEVKDLRFTVNGSYVGITDLRFTVNGSYVGITDFIYDLEDDAELEFKIENFNMTPDVEKGNLKSTFVVRDINVNIANVTTSTVTEETTIDTQSTNETTGGNTTETTNENTVNTTNTVSEE